MIFGFLHIITPSNPSTLGCLNPFMMFASVKKSSLMRSSASGLSSLMATSDPRHLPRYTSPKEPAPVGGCVNGKEQKKRKKKKSLPLHGLVRALFVSSRKSSWLYYCFCYCLPAIASDLYFFNDCHKTHSTFS